MAADTHEISAELTAITERAATVEERFAAEVREVHPKYADSARNLLHYVALRQFDIRDLQDQLAELGLSSLGRAEQHVVASIRAVQAALHAIDDRAPRPEESVTLPFPRDRESIASHTSDLLGPPSDKRPVHIMVTLSSESATEYNTVRDLVAAGMDVARINCAHDERETWRTMIDNVRRASAELGSDCRIVMDLPGPKFRTGPLKPGPKILRVRPRRDALGNTVAPKRIRCFAEESGKYKTGALLVPAECIGAADTGDIIRFRDTRGRRRKMVVARKDKRGLVLEIYKSAYIATGTRLTLLKKKTGESSEYFVGELPAAEQVITLNVDDHLVLTRAPEPGEPAKRDDDGNVLTPARISCGPKEIFDQVAIGEPVSFNDGKIEGLIENVADGELVVRITRAKHTGSRLRGSKGVNFPKSNLEFDGLTEEDRENLVFIAEHADAVGLSFIRNPEDVIALQDELDIIDGHGLGIIAKIETERAFDQLLRIMLAAMRRYPAGIMIARGDLAVECGWVQLAVMQEEILWLCEAAHLPVIWATQVLEGKTKKGQPSRAEITDAAMAQRADCVMLNKGPHILAAIRMLDDILTSMQHHQRKKVARLPRLRIMRM